MIQVQQPTFCCPVAFFQGTSLCLLHVLHTQSDSGCLHSIAVPRAALSSHSGSRRALPVSCSHGSLSQM